MAQPTHLKSSSKPLTLCMVMSEVAADGTMMMGVRERWSEEEEREGGREGRREAGKEGGREG